MNSSDRESEPSAVLVALEEFLSTADVSPAVAVRLRELVAAEALEQSRSAQTRIAAPVDPNRHTEFAASHVDSGRVPSMRSGRSSRPPQPSVDLVKTRAARPLRVQGNDASTAGPDGEPRLQFLSLLGQGGMGEVHRARDHVLRRDLAMKVLHEQFATEQRMRDRFVVEAQITAQLAHPSIPPVHDLGELRDGRPYFSMKEVHGRTLSDLIDLGFAQFPESRRIEVFQRVCEAMAYAHARGAIHCDLKPHNVMVGTFGEVLVMDWGVARLVEPVDGPSAGTEARVTTDVNSVATSHEVVGTPAYMAPEQATGDTQLIGPASDVYALGVMLFELFAGHRPYHGKFTALVHLATLSEVPALPRRVQTMVDESLDEIVSRAMRPDPTERYPDARALGEAVAQWRDGALRREKALGIVDRARKLLPDLGPMREQANAWRAEAHDRLASLGPEATVDAKRASWTLEDDAARLEREQTLAVAEIEELLSAALVHSPNLPEARALLADLAFERHREAENRRDWDEADLLELRLRSFDVGRYADYLAGTALLSLDVEVPSRVWLRPYEVRDRQLAPGSREELGTSPIADRELPVGSYLLELESEGRPMARYPVVLRRRGAWSGTRPGENALARLAIPREGELTDDEVLVPAGCCELGGGGLPVRREWVEAFVVRVHPVTFRELAAFLADAVGARFRQSVLRDGSGLYRADWPAVGVSHDAAVAYAAWMAARTGAPWRLPTETEWEKAARGVDGRFYPWGDFVDGALCHVRTDEHAPVVPAPVHQFTTDCSPYGALGMAGNVREWCADAFAPTSVESSDPNVLRVVRGGSFRLPLEAARVTARGGLVAQRGLSDVGFRLVRSFR